MTTQPAVPVPSGLELAPFRALRYDPTVAGPLDSLTSPPYDVIDEDGVRQYEATSPYNVVRLILPREAPQSGGSAYDGAAALLREWRDAGVLRPDPEPALYAYEMREGESVTRGLIGALGLVDPDAGIVLPHENTMAGPVSDRLALTAATECNTEPIYLVYDGGGVASAVVSDVGGQQPVAEATADDGITHRLWAITDPDVLEAVAADLRTRRAVIADGHHRYANFLRHQADRHAAGAGNGPWDRGLAFLVDATAFGPQVHAIHRVVPSLPVTEAARLAESAFTVRRLDDGPLDVALDALAAAGKAGTAFVLSGPEGRWLVTDPAPAELAAYLPSEASAAWRSLDVTVAHHLLVRAVWHLTDDEDTVWYRHDAPAAEAAAAEHGGTALLLNPTPVEAVIAVAAAGERMPRKSTYFTPKPRTGFVLRAYADA
ncbi:MAG TPA: DUF1015 domain-containing protein [Frankiaceae bacterium]|nr:DUF1015 domain-containing protein [Frankiaceae bacterium]